MLDQVGCLDKKNTMKNNNNKYFKLFIGTESKRYIKFSLATNITNSTGIQKIQNYNEDIFPSFVIQIN